eukprot:c20661_g1_i3 orf=333-2045(+)
MMFPQVALCVSASGLQFPHSNIDAGHLLRSAELADKWTGLTAPHPNLGCVIARGSQVIGEGSFYGEGTVSAEVQAVERAGEYARGATAYVNLEPGDCHGDDRGMLSLLQADVSRVVVGLRHPLKHFRGKSIKALRRAGIKVDVVGENLRDNGAIEEALKACMLVNAPLLYRAACQVPFSTLKYAMTLDGKIAATTGHSAWVSGKMSRERVLAIRGRSDAIIVGGNTVQQDNPTLTTKKEGGHFPVRIVMSRRLCLPEDAKLWDVSSMLTIVMTQQGARKDFQKILKDKGVQVVEFDFLTPKAVMDYCYDCGFMSVLWECGGTLAASAISSGIIHKVNAFVCTKIIGGITAPSPVGELGMVEMSQALNLIDISFEQIGPDLLVTGYLQPLPDLQHVVPAIIEDSITAETVAAAADEPVIISFYKSWDAFGAFCNFSPHAVSMPGPNGKPFIWKSVEHYYQECIRKIQAANSPEEAARLGRSLERQRPDLKHPDWDTVKLAVMYSGLKTKFSSYPFLRSLLLSTSGHILIETSPHDLFWGAGREGEGLNHLGRLLMKLRSVLETEEGGAVCC